MLCKVYRSDRRQETYLYLRNDLDFQDLPGPLQAHFGPPYFVMPLVLNNRRTLSRVDVRQVITALEAEGYFLQLPPELPVEEEIARRFS
jgi:uncharacterized protein YcgL (UPF0745 family)